MNNPQPRRGKPEREEGPGSEILRLLESAFLPVEPPASFAEELEQRLANVQAAALEALEDLEAEAMRDPRNWVRPAAALAAGTVAGTALVILRMRRGHRHRAGGLKGMAEQGGRELLDAVEWTRTRLR
jgi:hypothetical protein